MKRFLFGPRQLFVIASSLCLLGSCSLQKQISKSAAQVILKAPALSTALVGISIYEPAKGKYWFNYQGDHYFVPASNTKIPTCYVAMKYLGDSLVSILKAEDDTAILFIPWGDPTVLHPDFQNQPAIRYLQNVRKKIYTTDLKWKEESLGAGWSWNDYNDDYMAERSPMPVYGNLIKWVQEQQDNETVVYSVPEVNWSVDFDTAKEKNFSVTRSIAENRFEITEGKEERKEQDVPFITHGIKSALELLADTVGAKINLANSKVAEKLFSNKTTKLSPIHSQPTDSVLKPMMHRSDNFFAVQSLLMVSMQRLFVMSDEKIIDTILKSDLKDLPQKPRWVDGSGLSRYNLFSPQDFVFILNKMKNDFGMERIKNIFPTGNTGTLRNYYINEGGYIFAKTGSLGGVVALSGFLYTRKNKLLIFSVLVNNHNASAPAIRRVVEKFIEGTRNRY